ncbi:oxidoreductase [Kribbella kalugense]|uniref:NAD(P)-dependent dehydrogenase (Short-subunit alcohol dehydrogenase family) n=1 Tax=Kribbella kalugense TaxID=2512221 RepID=A0A4R8A7L5_9ACTN|nr:oxidoreductase [Kribbella kalugense]TDW24320.1 NAD(P)-dependent dehydrogenase (short-subunit alcohol dehydrogenase family) [Kribbella kalugense]
MDIPSQLGRHALVTGGTGGIGFETAVALAKADAEVVIAGRAKAKVDQAVAAVREAVGTAKVEGLVLDLASLASIESAASAVVAGGRPLDLLINNAGIMAVPERRETADGFELTFGTNHLGHFALTGRLLPALLAAPAARVVTVSAKVSRNKGATLKDPLSLESYESGMASYTKSKLANVVFTLELARRAAGTGITAVAVHPGTSSTGLQQHLPRYMQVIASMVLERFVGQSPADAARPSVYAATNSGVKAGDFVVPDGRAELRGVPHVAEMPPAATDPAVGRELWELSEKLTHVTYAFH